MKINDFKKLLSKKDILKLIQTRKNKYFNNSYIEMPQIILTESDLYFFEHFSSKPNFITDKSVQGQIVEITDKTINNNLKNKIVFIKNADPGYDWIFNHEIAGLVTMYGGANSHMAIRSSEISMVSAIGIGYKKFNELLKYKYIEIDSLNKRIIEIL